MAMRYISNNTHIDLYISNDIAILLPINWYLLKMNILPVKLILSIFLLNDYINLTISKLIIFNINSSNHANICHVIFIMGKRNSLSFVIFYENHKF